MVNPAIAMGVKQLELPDPLAQYGKIAAIQQAQNQNALAQYQLGAAQRSEAAQNALSTAYQQAYNPQTGEVDANRLRQVLATGGFGSQIPAVEKSLGELKTQRLTQQQKEGEIVAQLMKETQTALGQVRTPEDWLSIHIASHRHPILGPRLAAMGLTEEAGTQKIMELAKNPEAFRQGLLTAQAGALEFARLNAPKTVTQDIGGETRVVSIPGLGGPATVVPGSVAAKTMAPGEAERLRLQAQQVKLEGQRLGLEGRRVAVLEANAVRDSDPEFQQRMEAARTVGRKAAEGNVAAQQALPRVISRAEEGIRLIDELVGKRDSKGNLIKGSKPHPGFENAVGATWLPGARFVPGTDAAGFMSRFDQIKGASFLEAFESLKGGGAITEKEGAKATDAINRMSIAADEKEFVSAAMDLQEVIRKGVETAQRKATGGSPRLPSAPQQPATPSVSPTIDALLKKYQ